MYIVYTLSKDTDFQHAVNVLQKTQDDLPEGAFQQLCRRNEQGLQEAIPWMPFGDLVQILDFPSAWQAQEFEDSDAGKAQNERTKGLFSNVAAISCPIV
jgi:hypothetical protein